MGTMDPKAREAYIRTIEADLARLRQSLAPLESGEMHMQHRGAGEPWRDTTADTIEHHRRSIQTLECILMALRKGEVP